MHLKTRAEKFGSEYIPITLTDYKLYKIKKASETGKMEYLEGVLLEDIHDMTERKRRIKERTEKFFPSIKVESDPNSNYKIMKHFSINDKTLILAKTTQ